MDVQCPYRLNWNLRNESPFGKISSWKHKPNAWFVVELVGGIFGFPVAMMEIELVAEGAVGADVFAADFAGELRDEVPVGFLARGGEQVLEGGASRAFVGYLVRGVAAELVVVAANFFVRGFEAIGKGHVWGTRRAETGDRHNLLRRLRKLSQSPARARVHSAISDDNR
jgi:hypothetical protein